MATATEAVQQIRFRPGMYVGSTGSYGLQWLLTKPLMAFYQALLAKRGTTVSVRVGPNLELEAILDGLLDALESPEAMQAAVLDGEPESDSSKTLSWLPICNALAEHFEVSAWQGTSAWWRSFARGVPQGGCERIPTTQLHLSSGPATGTRISFVPDGSIFKDRRVSLPGFTNRVQHLAALSAGATWTLSLAGESTRTLRYAAGLKDFVEELGRERHPLHKAFAFAGRRGSTDVRLALQWCRAPGSLLFAWANEVFTSSGTHVSGLVNALHHAVSEYAVSAGRQGEFFWFSPSALLDGVTVAMSLRSTAVKWDGSMKGTLGSKDVAQDFEELARGWLAGALAEHPDVGAQVLDRLGVELVVRGP